MPNSARCPQPKSEMHVQRSLSKLVSVLVGVCVLLVFSSFSSPTQALAHTRTQATGGPALQMNVGFDPGSGVGSSRVDYWTPVQVVLTNTGPDFKGTLSASTYTSSLPSGSVINSISPWSYQEPVTVPHGAQKQIMLSVPFYENPTVPKGVIVTLRDNHGKVILTQTNAPYALRAGAFFVGTLADQNANFAPLNAVLFPSPTRSIEMAALDANTMPDTAEMLGNFDAIILDDFTAGVLNSGQLNALRTWVNQGGALIEVGGPAWQRTLGSLPPDLLPVVVHGTEILPAGSRLLPIGGPSIADIGQQAAPPTIQKLITISTATLAVSGNAGQGMFSAIETVLASDTPTQGREGIERRSASSAHGPYVGSPTPLIVQAHEGEGVICYLAFDPATEPIASWPGAVALWEGLLLRTPGDQFLLPDTPYKDSSGPGQVVLRAGLLQILQPGPLFPLWELVGLLFGYILLIGPVRLLIVKRLKRPNWSWRIALSGMVVFSLLTYGVVFYQKGASINSISLIQFDQGGSSAHITTFTSIFIPTQGDVQIHVPGRSLIQPLSDAPFRSGLTVLNGDESTEITLGQDETTVSLPDVGLWTLHPFVSERDQQLHGSIVAQLTLQGNTLIGTVTNTLASSLSDVYVLLPHSFAYLGHLAAGETQQFTISLHNAPLNTGTTLADQIAMSNGLPAPYFPYAHNASPQNDFQRHLALLSALSGEGFDYIPCAGVCSTHAIVTRHTIVTPPPGGPKVNPIDGSDPLLLTGAPATLVGWADQPLDSINAVTVNGITPGGTHDNFVQVPLNLNFVGALKLPPNLISGQVINAQGSDVQTTQPSVYSMSTGSVTFEFMLPDLAHLQLNSITITEPFWESPKNISHVQIRLYNWSTGTWDTIMLSQDSFTIANIKAYTSLDGRILLQVANQNSSSGTLFFGRPSLSLNGNVTSS